MGENDKDALYRQIVESAGDAVIFADRDGSSASGTGRRKGCSATRKRRLSGSRWT